MYGLGRTALAVCGTACVTIDVGDGRPLEHEIEALDTNNRVVILGRRFSYLPRYLPPFSSQSAEIMQTEMGKEGDSLEAMFDINPKLSPREDTVEMERRFRGKPEEPARNWNRGTRYHSSG